MNKYVLTITASVFTLIAVMIISGYRGAEDPALEDFANCLTDKGIVMYGAEWCPHCKNEKKRFGAAFEDVAYVECPDEPEKCITAGIEGYPTWIFPDGYSPTGSPVKGKIFKGEQGLEKLSKESGCPLKKVD